MACKKIFGLVAASFMLVFLIGACAAPKEVTAPSPAQPAVEPQPVQEEAKQQEIAKEEAVVPEEIKAFGEGISSADETSSELNTEDLADVEGALAEIENI